MFGCGIRVGEVTGTVTIHGEPAPENPVENTATASGESNRWIVMQPDKLVTWDNFKLKDLRKR